MRSTGVNGTVDGAYAVLGVTRRSSQGDVRRAYRDLLRRFHPDTNGGDRTAEERLRAVQAAYEQIGRTRTAPGARSQAWPSSAPAQAARSSADVVRAELRAAYRAGLARPASTLDVLAS